MPAAHELPDSVFIEDTAIVLEELAVITRPGAVSRQAEATAVASTLGAFRQLQFLDEPASLDGGDVLRLGRTLYVGVGSRTNAAGVQQLRDVVSSGGYEVRSVAVDGCLHLKSAITEVAPGIVILNPAWIDSQVFANHEIIRGRSLRARGSERAENWRCHGLRGGVSADERPPRGRGHRPYRGCVGAGQGRGRVDVLQPDLSTGETPSLRTANRERPLRID